MPKISLIPQDVRPMVRRWVEDVLETYHLRPDSTEYRLLIEAARALDRAEDAREILKTEGLTAMNSRGAVVPHPCVAIERDSRTLFARLARDLGLDPIQS